MKKMTLSVTLFCFLFSSISIGWAEPYQSKSFPSKKVFETYKGKKYRSVGKWRNDHEVVWAFGIYERQGGSMGSDYLGMFIKLDNDYWMQRQLETETWQLFDPEKKK